MQQKRSPAGQTRECLQATKRHRAKKRKKEGVDLRALPQLSCSFATVPPAFICHNNNCEAAIREKQTRKVVAADEKLQAGRSRC